jgi:hypothetical protein
VFLLGPFREFIIDEDLLDKSSLKFSCYLIFVGMGLHWLGYDIGIVGSNTFVAILQVNYLAFVETITPKYRVFCVLTVTTLATKSDAVVTAKLLLNCRFHHKDTTAKSSYKPGRSALYKKTKHSKESEYWLNQTSISNCNTALLEEEREDQ